MGEDKSLEYFFNNIVSVANGSSKDIRVSIQGHISPTTIVSNRKAVGTAGVAVKLIADSTPCFRVDLSADLGNTNPVVVGGSTVKAASDS